MVGVGEVQREPAAIVHILLAGRALCGRTGEPGDWPPGHMWVSLHEFGLATCLGCVVRASTVNPPPKP